MSILKVLKGVGAVAGSPAILRTKVTGEVLARSCGSLRGGQHLLRAQRPCMPLRGNGNRPGSFVRRGIAQSAVNESSNKEDAKDLGARKKLILYSKPGCCLCDGLKEKVEAILMLEEAGKLKDVELEIRNIETRPEWFEAFQYEIPVLAVQLGDGTEVPVLRPSPRFSIDRLQVHLEKALP